MKQVLRRRPSAATIVAIVALVLALGGTAVAAGTIKLGALTNGAKNKTVGVGKLTYVTTTTALPNVNTNYPGVNVLASCPSGRQVIGGGIKVSNDAESDINDSHPTTSGWAGTVNVYGAGTGRTATVTAICAVSRAVTGAPPSS